MSDEPEPGARAALGLALRIDPGLAADPSRLRRALADLAPHDERGINLTVMGAEAGVPALLAGDQAAEAHARLADVCGCRSDAARWVVTTWSLALGRGAGGDGGTEEDRDAWAGGLADPPDALGELDELGEPGALDEREPEGLDGPWPVESPGAPTALRVGVWPDGAPALAVISMDGLFVLDDARRPARGRWRRVAAVRTPIARDVALALDRRPGQVLWSDHDGLHARVLGRPSPSHAGPTRLGGPRLLASPPAGEEARYPLAALADDSIPLRVIWTADRRRLTSLELRDWLAAPAVAALPSACGEGERLVCLDACAETGRTAWLVCLTDRGRVLAARWDLSLGECGRWQVLDPPVAVVCAAIATLRGTPVIIAATAEGNLLSVDARAAAGGRESWHSVDRPAGVLRSGSAGVLSAGAPGRAAGWDGTGWLAVTGGGGLWAAPVDRNGSVVECGDPVRVWLAE